MFGRRSDEEGEGDPGEVAARCASMLRGGVAPGRVFRLMADEGPVGSSVSQINARVEGGETPGTAIARCQAAQNGGTGWKILAASWQLAEETGAPLADALERTASSLRSLQRLQDRRDVLLSGPRATIRLVAALPPLVLALGWLLGFDPSPVLLSWAGMAMLSVGLTLLVAGVLWAQRLTRRLQSEDRVAGIELELAAVALGGGSAPRDAVRRVVDCVDRNGIEWVSYEGFCDDGALMKTLRRSAAIGMPLGPMLLAEAAALRDSSHAELESGAERLGVRVLIPLGVCVLPSFIVMGVLPVVISMMTGGSL